MSAGSDPQSMPNASQPADALRLVLETALDAVVFVSGEGIIVGWNDHSVKMFGWTRRRRSGAPLPI